MRTTPRRRSRYAPDAQIERAIDFARRHRVCLVLGADGSIEVRGWLNPGEGGTAEEDPEEALGRWKRQRDAALRQAKKD